MTRVCSQIVVVLTGQYVLLSLRYTEVEVPPADDTALAEILSDPNVRLCLQFDEDKPVGKWRLGQVVSGGKGLGALKKVIADGKKRASSKSVLHAADEHGDSSGTKTTKGRNFSLQCTVVVSRKRVQLDFSQHKFGFRHSLVLLRSQ